MNSEQRRVRAKFAQLKHAPIHYFPQSGARIAATDKRGVYVIYSPRGKVLHVGATPRGRRGIAQRLFDHLRGQSSFTRNSQWLKKHAGPKLNRRCAYVRKRCTYQCLAVKDERLRALLETYAIGHLCPDHIGLHQIVS
jgi:hypothetical protein